MGIEQSADRKRIDISQPHPHPYSGPEVKMTMDSERGPKSVVVSLGLPVLREWGSVTEGKYVLVISALYIADCTSRYPRLLLDKCL